MVVVAKVTALVFAVEVVVVAIGRWSGGGGSEGRAGGAGGNGDVCLQSWRE